MEFNNIIKYRYSCRAFAERAVVQEKVDRILEAGRIARINVGYPSEASAPSAMHGSRVAMEKFVTRV